MSKTKAKEVDISPSPGILSVLQHVNYKPWSALAEYIDNSIQSSLDHQKELIKLYKGSYRLEVSIAINQFLNQIEVVDNAAGIAFKDFPRAFRTAKVPDNRKGLSEFGMGMKCASCWFGKNWQVRTKFLKDNIERVVDFDVDEIVENERASLPCQERIAKDKKPYTVITIRNIQKIPKGRTVTKIKDYLADIYRIFIRDGTIVIRLNGEKLEYQPSGILVAPYYAEPKGPDKQWEMKLDFKLNDGQTVKGFAALLENGSRLKSGFALFRRGRVIQGSGEDGYRPPQIFGTQSTFRFLRIFGELHLDGFGVSHTKDGFKWDENEEEFIDKLLEQLKKQEEFLKQADRYRVRNIVDGNKHLDESISAAVGDLDEEPVKEALDAVERQIEDIAEDASYEAYNNQTVYFRDIQWKVSLQFNKELGSDDWIKVTDKTSTTTGNYKELEIDIALNHKIMLEYGTANKGNLGLLIKFAISVGIASYTAKLVPGKGSFVFINAFNELASQYISKQGND